jgi:hypothetical protein
LGSSRALLLLLLLLLYVCQRGLSGGAALAHCRSHTAAKIAAPL